MKRTTIFTITLFFLSITSISAQLHLLRLDFNGNTNDRSGNNNHGIVNGATLSPDRFGNPNSAYYFDGMDDHIQIPYSNIFNVDSLDFALSLWIKTTNSNSPGMIFQKGREVQQPQFWLRLNDDVLSKELVFLTSDGNPQSDYVSADTSGIIDGEWHHIIAQRRKDTLEVFCDSKLVSQSVTNQPYLSDSSSIIIGAQNPNIYRDFAHYHFEGYIDDIKLFRTYLSQFDVQDLYNEEKCTGYILDTIRITDTILIQDTVMVTVQNKQLLRLDFNGNSNDRSGYNNHGIVNGATLVSDRFGYPNSAYYFDGIDDHIQIPYSNIFNVDSLDFALSLWINTTNSNSPGMIFQKGGEVQQPQFWLRSNDDVLSKELVFLTSDGNPPSDYVSADTSDIIDGEWHHIIAQRRKDTLEIFCDSKLVSQSVTHQPYLSDSSSIIIGAQNPNIYRDFVHYHFEGYIDDIKLYRTSLSKFDVQDIYKEENRTGFIIDTITITDTLVIQDTVYVTIQDTLIIDVQLSSATAAKNTLIKVYPNPTNDILYISIGDFQSMLNYKVKIIDNSARVIYESLFNQPELMIHLADFGTSGLYYLEIYDENLKLLSSRKIVFRK